MPVRTHLTRALFPACHAQDPDTTLDECEPKKITEKQTDAALEVLEAFEAK
jgi:hypothetical protein